MQDSSTNDEDDSWLGQKAITMPKKETEDDSWLGEKSVLKPEQKKSEEKKGDFNFLRTAGHFLLGVGEGTLPSLIASGIQALMKGAARNAFAEQMEDDLFNKYAYGLEMPELSKEKFEEQLQGYTKDSPLAKLVNAAGFDTETKNEIEEAVRSSGFGATAGGKTGAAVGAALPYLMKKLDMAPELEEAMGDAFALTMAHHGIKKATKPKGAVEAVKPKEVVLKDELPGKTHASDYHVGLPIKEELEALRAPMLAQQEKQMASQQQQKLDLRHEQQMALYEKKRAAAEAKALKEHQKKIQLEEEQDFQASREQEKQNFKDTLNNIFLDTPDKSSLQIGRETAAGIRQAAQKANQNIKRAYDKAVDMQRNIFSARPEMAESIDGFIRQYDALPSSTLSSAENKALAFARGIRSMIKDGREISNAELIKMEQSLNNIMNFDIKPHPTGVFAPLKKAIASEIKSSSKGTAYEAYETAKNMHADFEKKFGNEIVEPWRNSKKLEHDTMAKRALTKASHLEALAQVLPSKELGTFFKSAIKESLENHIKKGDIEGYNKALREIADALPENLQLVLEDLAPKERPPSRVETAPFSFEYPEKPPEKINYETKKKAISAVKESPEQITRKLLSISGIEELEKELGKNSKALQAGKEHAAQQMLTGGRQPEHVTIKNFKDVMENTNKRAVLERLTSEETVSKMDRLIAETEQLERKLASDQYTLQQKQQIKVALTQLVITVGTLGFDVGGFLKAKAILDAAKTIGESRKNLKQQKTNAP